MGDWFDHYVARRLEVPDANERAERLVAWLLSNELIEPGLTDAPLGGDGYRPGKRASEVLEHPSDDLHTLRTNGVRILTERTVFYAFNTQHVRCPRCAAETARETWEEALGEWDAGDGTGLVRCDGCGADIALCDLVMDDQWGFSNFGITFWNWGALADRWERQLAAVMGVPIVHVSGKL